MPERVFAYTKLGLNGRLGNQLWQVAATAARAQRESGRAFIPPDWEYRPYLNVPDSFYLPPQRGDWVADMETHPRGPYFQTLWDIAPVQYELKGWFSPSEKGAVRFNEIHGALLDRMDDGEHFTAMHIRRGDYLMNPERFPQLTAKYWQAALEFSPSDSTVLVFSDDIKWCRENQDTLGVRGRAEFIEGHVRPIPVRRRIGEPADIYDLWLMARCQNHVLANSTYSWWGAYLSEDSMPIYPDRWFGKSAVGSERQWDAFPESWVQLPC